MKKHFFIGLILVNLGLIANAQWSVTDPVITTSKVGIGITTPLSALHVAGNQNLSWTDPNVDPTVGTGLVTIGDKGGNGSLFINTPSVNNRFPSGLGIDGSYDATNRLSLVNIKAFGTKSPYFYSTLAFYTTNGTSLNEAMRIDPGGNVGIGTTTPLAKLHITGNQNLSWADPNVDQTVGTGLVTIGDKGGNGSLFINTPSINNRYPSGLGIDGSYDATNRISRINIKAFGTNSPYYYSTLAFYTSNGTSLNEAMRIDAGGNVGIGTTAPDAPLEVANATFPMIEVANTTTNGRIQMYVNPSFGGMISTSGNPYALPGDLIYRALGPSHNLLFLMSDNNNDAKSYIEFGDGYNGGWFKIYNNATMRIDGTVFAKELDVVPNVWADNVFKPEYKLKTLAEIENYIKTNGHLEDIPTESQVKEKGINVADMNATLLKKVEEITLLMIEQNKRIETLEKENNELKTKVEAVSNK